MKIYLLEAVSFNIDEKKLSRRLWTLFKIYFTDQAFFCSDQNVFTQLQVLFHQSIQRNKFKKSADVILVSKVFDCD